jgi:hypothetical protein
MTRWPPLAEQSVVQRTAYINFGGLKLNVKFHRITKDCIRYRCTIINFTLLLGYPFPDVVCASKISFTGFVCPDFFAGTIKSRRFVGVCCRTLVPTSAPKCGKSHNLISTRYNFLLHPFHRLSIDVGMYMWTIDLSNLHVDKCNNRTWILYAKWQNHQIKRFVVLNEQIFIHFISTLPALLILLGAILSLHFMLHATLHIMWTRWKFHKLYNAHTYTQ